MELEHSPDRELFLLSMVARQHLAQRQALEPGADLTSSLACLDAMLTLHHRVMTGRDRFLLSGRRALWALEATLASLPHAAPGRVLAPVASNRQGWVLTSRQDGVLATSDGAELMTGIGPALASAGAPHADAGRVFVLLGLDDLPSVCGQALKRVQAAAPMSPVTLLVDCNARPGPGSEVVITPPSAAVHVDGNDHLALAAAVRAHPGGTIFLHTSEAGATQVFESAYAC